MFIVTDKWGSHIFHDITYSTTIARVEALASLTEQHLMLIAATETIHTAGSMNETIQISLNMAHICIYTSYPYLFTTYIYPTDVVSEQSQLNFTSIDYIISA